MERDTAGRHLLNHVTPQSDALHAAYQQLYCDRYFSDRNKNTGLLLDNIQDKAEPALCC